MEKNILNENHAGTTIIHSTTELVNMSKKTKTKQTTTKKKTPTTATKF